MLALAGLAALAAYKTSLLTQTPRVSVSYGPYVSTQVNVDPTGTNIQGDFADEPSIARDPRFPLRMVVAFRVFHPFPTSDFNRNVGYATTVDGGATWTYHLDDIKPRRTDPVLASDLAGNFYLGTYDLGDFDNTDTVEVMQSSTDEFVSGRLFAGSPGDKDWLTVDQSGSSGTGNLYLVSSPQEFPGIPPNVATFARSVDGVYFQPRVESPGHPYIPTLAIGVRGEVYVAGPTSYIDPGSGLPRFGDFAFARSSDARNRSSPVSFDLQRVVSLGGVLPPSYEGAPINGSGILGVPWLAVDKSSTSRRGTIYLLCSVDPPGPDPLDVMIVKSANRGGSWSAPVRVNPAAPTGVLSSQWFGTLSIAPNGRLDVIWYDSLLVDASDVQAAVMYSYSTDGANSWSYPVQVSPSFYPARWYPPTSPKLGDYVQSTSDDDGMNVAYAATFNGEDDIWFVRIPNSAHP